MGNYRSDNRSQGRRDFGGRRERPQLYKAVCANCGNDCEVPFKPTGSKPVFCRNCFDKQGGSDRGGRSNFSRDSRGLRDSRGRRDSDNFQNRASNQPNYQEKFDALNAKLDRILAILEPIVSLEADQVELTEEPVEEPKEKAPKKKAKKASKKEVVLTPEVESEVKE